MSVSPPRAVGYIQVLKENSRFRRLWIAQLISAGGDWFNSVAVLGLVLQLTQSGLGASLIVVCSTLPTFFLIPIVGPVVDRFDRRNLMIITNVISTGLALLFLLVKDSSMVWLLYVGTILLVVSASFFAPASTSSIPNIVSQDELFSANALSGANWGIMVMVGSAVGGLVSARFGRDIAFIVNALSFLVAAALIATIDIPSPKSERRIEPWRDFIEGLNYLRHYLPGLALVAVKTGWGFGAGAIVLFSVMSVQVFHAGDAGIGFLYSGRGMGALVGPIIVQALVGRKVDRLRNALWIAFLIAGVGYSIFALSGWLNMLWLGVIGLLIGHFGGGTLWIIGSTLLQITTPDRFRGRIFAVDFGLATLTTGSSTLVYGLALQGGISPMFLALVAAAIFVVYGLLWGYTTSKGSLKISEATVAQAVAGGD
jgi:MFS family permease